MGDKNVKILLPKEVEHIIGVLKNNNYEAYIVGGCVRDSLLKRNPKDWDITTNAVPEAVIKIFELLDFRVVPTGLQHGTVTVVINKESFEITTYRTGEISLDGNANFAKILQEDLSKRDFTINAMAYNDEYSLVDYFNGFKHLEGKIIKAVENPFERFSEDPLRMLRAYRFSAQLGFEIEKQTKEAIENLSSSIRTVSIERIREEFNKILISDNPKEIHNINRCGLLKHFIPEFNTCEETDQQNPHHIHSVGEHIIKTVENIENQLHLRLTMFFHDIAKPQCKTVDEKGIGHFYRHNDVSAVKAEEILKAMKYDTKTIERVTILVKYHDREVVSSKSIRKLLNLIGEENFRDLLKVKEADMKGQNPIYYEENHKKLIETEEKLNLIISSKQCFTIKELAISGKDLMKLGIKEGKKIGEILNKLLAAVLEKPELNNRDTLLELIKAEKCI